MQITLGVQHTTLTLYIFILINVQTRTTCIEAILSSFFLEAEITSYFFEVACQCEICINNNNDYYRYKQ